MDNEIVNLVKATAREAAIEAMAAVQDRADSNRGLTRDDVLSAFREVMAPPSDPAAASDDDKLPSVDETAMHKRGWGDLQDIISGKVAVNLTGGRYARSK